jgi:hypothetical protein
MTEARRLALLIAATVVIGCGASKADSGGDPQQTGAIALAAGGGFSCAILSGGAVRCWGRNSHGQLGNGSNQSSAVPVEVVGLTDAIEISAGASFACAIRADGTVWCWGDNREGELGDGTAVSSNVPVQVHSLAAASNITTGATHACVLTGIAGEAKCWGANNVSQLGSEPALQQGLTPLSVFAVFGATSLGAGGLHTCAIAGGAVLCWGALASGTDGSGVYYHATPLPDGQGFTRLSKTGGNHACALTIDRRVGCWGSNGSGELGDGTTDYRSSPVYPSGIHDAISVSAGGGVMQLALQASTCAARAGGDVWCWGSNPSGQLGDGTTSDRSTPAPVTALSGVVEVAVGAVSIHPQGAHACARRADGSVACWGQNDVGQLGDGSTIERATPVEVVF